jgi:ATP-binding cassette subfamily F protein uup
LKPDAGSVIHAEGLRVVTFEQHRDSLDQSATLRRSLAPAGDAVIYRDRAIHLISWAKRFLFRPEQLDLPVSRLSGGEQARLLIARLMLQPADLLILDEPTNDLDIPTLDVLEESLMEFPGALVLVTHDRWLLDRVSTSLLALDGDGRAGLYADYAQWEAAQLIRAEPARRPDSAANDSPTQGAPASPTVPPITKRKGLSYREQREWDAIEGHILEAEQRVADCQAALQDPDVSSDASALQERCVALETAQVNVERLYARWAELDEKRGAVFNETARSRGTGR